MVLQGSRWQRGARSRVLAGVLIFENLMFSQYIMQVFLTRFLLRIPAPFLYILALGRISYWNDEAAAIRAFIEGCWHTGEVLVAETGRCWSEGELRS
jgi:hypothetical protein